MPTEALNTRRKKATGPKPTVSDLEHMINAGKAIGLEVKTASLDDDFPDDTTILRLRFRKRKNRRTGKTAKS